MNDGTSRTNSSPLVTMTLAVSLPSHFSYSLQCLCHYHYQPQSGRKKGTTRILPREKKSRFSPRRTQPVNFGVHTACIDNRPDHVCKCPHSWSGLVAESAARCLLWWLAVPVLGFVCVAWLLPVWLLLSFLLLLARWPLDRHLVDRSAGVGVVLAVLVILDDAPALLFFGSSSLSAQDCRATMHD
ncbi:hypothetical protein HDK77DRAFT_174401 [Phyllosticta capitalensis]|uniref:Uncharacterized protein n=1 Tax=Phyllosticta capitalensis TaxID=121624 RepID=A0ABR1YRX7_9PEZI